MLSPVQLFLNPRTVTHQAPLPWDSPGKNTGVGSHYFLQGIFLTQESNPCLLHPLHRQAEFLPFTTWGDPLAHMPRRDVGVDGRGAFISGPTDKIALVIVSERKQDLEDIEGI